MKEYAAIWNADEEQAQDLSSVVQMEEEDQPLAIFKEQLEEGVRIHDNKMSPVAS